MQVSAASLGLLMLQLPVLEVNKVQDSLGNKIQDNKPLGGRLMITAVPPFFI